MHFILPTDPAWGGEDTSRFAYALPMKLGLAIPLGLLLASSVATSLADARGNDALVQLDRLTSDNQAMYEDARRWFVGCGAECAEVLTGGLTDTRLGLQTQARILSILGELALPSTWPAVYARFRTALDVGDDVVLPAAMDALAAFKWDETRIALIDVLSHPDPDRVRHAVFLLVDDVPIRFRKEWIRSPTQPREQRELVVNGPDHLKMRQRWPIRKVIVDALIALLDKPRSSWQAQVMLAALTQNFEERKLVLQHSLRPETWWLDRGNSVERWRTFFAQKASTFWPAATAAECRQQIYALVANDLYEWRDLPPGCTRFDVAEALRLPSAAEEGSGILSGQATIFRRYPATKVAPLGFQVWFRDEVVVAIEMHGAKLEPDDIDRIGPPAERDYSPVARGHGHWLYPSHGLILHKQRGSNELFGITAVPRCTLDSMRKLPWVRDTPIRDKRRL